MTKKILAVFIVMGMLTGYETSMNETQSGALAGTALGAGLGAIIGSQTGHAGAGTAIGAGAGALAGGLFGEGLRRNREKQTVPPPQYQYPAQTYQPPAPQVQQVHTKFNPRTGETFPESYTYDPKDGTELQYIQ